MKSADLKSTIIQFIDSIHWSPLFTQALVVFFCGLLVGGLVVWLRTRSRFKKQLADAHAQQAFYQERLKVSEASQEQMTNSFKALSADALRDSQESFLTLAKQTLAREREVDQGDMDRRRQEFGELVKPVHDSLSRVDERIHEIEKSREGAYHALRQQVDHMADTQQNLRKETSNLVRALRQPIGRGQWGEMQLRRVVEMSGMQEQCDFNTQTSVTNEDGQRLRPDLTVKLPGNKLIVVDAKSPMEAYLDAIEAREQGDDEAVKEALDRHAGQVRKHIRDLGRKSYQNQFSSSPEFTVMFLPSESFFSEALSHDPGLIDVGVKAGVILATPTTLIALLRTIAYGWRQEALAENAQAISDLGHELYQRLGIMGDHFTKVGKSLNHSVNAYNQAAASLESRVFTSARKFRELGATPTDEADLESPKLVSSLAREVQLETAADLHIQN